MSLKRACWCRKGDGFGIRHLKSVRKDGMVLTDEIKEDRFSDGFSAKVVNSMPC